MKKNIEKIKFYLDKKNWVLSKSDLWDMGELVVDLSSRGMILREWLKESKCNLGKKYRKYGERVLEEFSVRFMIDNMKGCVSCIICD